MAPDPSTTPAQPRLLSLDAFRGLTVAGMILVNNPGTWSHIYPPLGHARWHGWTPTDLVFPSFLFIVGVAIPLSLGKRLDRGDSPASLWSKVLRRSLIILALGLFLNAFPFQKPLTGLRFPGVLQRIGLCYFFTSLIFLTTGLRTQAALVFSLLIGYWLALTRVPVPGIGAGDLSLPNNLAAWIDRAVMSGHLYKPQYDPEGLLSTLPAIATTLLGVLAGRWLRVDRPIGERIAGLIGAGSVLYVLGWEWGTVFPVNKALWTSSFVLLTAGIALQVFGLCAFLLEILHVRRWALPFLIFGSNPIVAFVGSGLMARLLTLVTIQGQGGTRSTLRSFLWDRGFAPWFEPTLASFLFAVSYVLFWLLVLAILYRLRWFVRV